MIAYCEVSMRLFVNKSFIVNESCSYERPPEEMSSLCLRLPEHDHWGYQKSANLLTSCPTLLPTVVLKIVVWDFPNTSQHFLEN